MKIKMWWVPRSERGRQVARFLRANDFDVHDKDVLGHHLANVPGAGELTTEQLREIAYILDPDEATAHDRDIEYAIEALYNDTSLMNDERKQYIKEALADW